MSEKRAWSLLEIIRLVIGLLTPLSICFLAYTLDLHWKEAEQHRKEAGLVRKETPKPSEEKSAALARRVQLWDKVAYKLNDIYSYNTYLNNWKDISPQDVISARRETDKIILSNRQFFTDDFIARYQDFMQQAFKAGNRWKDDFRLRALPVRDRDKGSEAMFTGEDNTGPIHDAYSALMEESAREFDLKITSSPQPTATPNDREKTKAKATVPAVAVE